MEKKRLVEGDEFVGLRMQLYMMQLNQVRSYCAESGPVWLVNSRLAPPVKISTN